MTVGPDGRRALSASGVWALAVTPERRRALSASADGTLRLWDLGTGQTIYTLEGHTYPVTVVAVMQTKQSL